MKVVNYLNLTNGLEWIKEINDYKTIRIQSTLCEAKAYDKLIRDLDYGFLFDLAQGYVVRIYDTSSHKKMSRALYQGIPFIEYVLRKRWLKNEPRAFVRGFDVTSYFNKEYLKLSNEAKAKLDYVKKFLSTSEIHIEVYCKHSKLDGKYDEFRELLRGGKDVS